MSTPVNHILKSRGKAHEISWTFTSIYISVTWAWLFLCLVNNVNHTSIFVSQKKKNKIEKDSRGKERVKWGKCEKQIKNKLNIF